MLVLSRKEEESVLFPTLEIAVQILRIQGKKVSLGIDAPADVSVLRNEISRASAEPSMKRSSKHWQSNRKSNATESDSGLTQLNGLVQNLHMKLATLEAQLRLGRSVEALATLRNAIEDLATLETNLHPPSLIVPSESDEHVLVI